MVETKKMTRLGQGDMERFAAVVAARLGAAGALVPSSLGRW